jgi:hypothetical protein
MPTNATSLLNLTPLFLATFCQIIPPLLTTVSVHAYRWVWSVWTTSPVLEQAVWHWPFQVSLLPLDRWEMSTGTSGGRNSKSCNALGPVFSTFRLRSLLAQSAVKGMSSHATGLSCLCVHFLLLTALLKDCASLLPTITSIISHSLVTVIIIWSFFQLRYRWLRQVRDRLMRSCSWSRLLDFGLRTWRGDYLLMLMHMHMHCPVQFQYWFDYIIGMSAQLEHYQNWKKIIYGWIAGRISSTKIQAPTADFATFSTNDVIW